MDYDTQQQEIANAAAIAQTAANYAALAAQQAAYQVAVQQATPFAQRYRALLRQYFGANAETNRAVTMEVVLGYFIQVAASGTITAQQTADAAILQTLFSALNVIAGDPAVGADNTWAAGFWELIP